ncbi:lymphatic vessel endothelial hyaluronic receptor 1b isoform X2 [Gambusia affinis]|uniref:lymphatic vessel endothelial hyaluronic receptor 1b isoform X2 n=1 Tax=Gambusia affinis TaxID=33528 RepID=UPI001CDCB4EA|nr:lymphatic vessel endothelial hyaluronic receptor 1b isoform X2 [Gambusia affinis]
MAGRFCFTSAFLLLFMLQLSASSLSKVVVQTDEPIGIFLLIDGGRYTLNFTEAQAACSFLKVTIATIAQMKEAVRHGLETCKYGWVAEKTAVVPRITSDKNCGKGNTGLVLWNTPPYSKFAVYCFNASALTDQNQTLDPSTATPQSPGSSTLPEALGPASSSAAPTSRSSTQSPPAVGNTSIPQPTEQAPSATASVTKATDLSSSSSPVKHLSSHIPASPHRLITSTPAGVTFSFPTSTQSPSLSVSSEPGLEPSVGSTRPLLDAAHISLISLSIVFLLLSAATAWWCYKSNDLRWYARRHKDDVETEMWRNSHGELDLLSEDGAAVEHDEELYSSDVTLCVNTGMETNSAE